MWPQDSFGCLWWQVTAGNSHWLRSNGNLEHHERRLGVYGKREAEAVVQNDCGWKDGTRQPLERVQRAFVIPPCWIGIFYILKTIMCLNPIFSSLIIKELYQVNTTSAVEAKGSSEDKRTLLQVRKRLQRNLHRNQMKLRVWYVSLKTGSSSTW